MKYAPHIVIGFAIVATVVAVIGIGRSSNMPPAAAMLPAVNATPLDVPGGREVATFAAGCFWCIEAVLQEQPGVDSVVSGYGGGTTPDPTYEQVIAQATDHREAAQVIYDPSIIAYDDLLEHFWQSIDPTDADGQFVDRGHSYTTAIFYHDDKQRTMAEQSLQSLDESGKHEQPIVTSILPYTTFYDAEEYHQDYYKKSSRQYKAYESASGR